MTCEEFATAGLDLGDAGNDTLLQRAARVHMSECPHCSALHENWLALREDLRAVGRETREAETPARVEMRLLQEFHTRHKTVKRHKAAMVLGWSLAVAATLVLAVTTARWNVRHPAGTETASVARVESGANANPVSAQSVNAADSGVSLVASNNAEDFTLLPDSMPPVSGASTVVHVEMQRAALSALGLAVNEEHAGDWIQVDLLVGDDGLPQAVRLPQNIATTAK